MTKKLNDSVLKAFFVLFALLFFQASVASAATLAEVKFVRRTNLNVDIYAVKASESLQVTRQATALAEYPFTEKINFDGLGKQFEKMRAMTGSKVGMQDYRIDTISGKIMGAEHVVMTILGSYSIGSERYFFTEIQEVKKKAMITTVATENGYQRPHLEWTESLHQQLNKKDRLPASDLADTTGKICPECIAKENKDKDLEALKANAAAIKETAAKAMGPSKEICQTIKAEHRKDLVVSLDTELLHRQEEEEFMEGLAKGTLSCSQRITEQLIQGGWDLVSFGALVVKLGAMGLWNGTKAVGNGIASITTTLFDSKERNNFLSSMQSAITSGVKKTNAGLQYLTENSISSILSAGGQAVSAKVQSTTSTAQVFGSTIKNLFKGYMGKQRDLWSCLKGREKIDYMCEWAGYAVALFIPPSVVYKMIKEGTLATKLFAASAKSMDKFVSKAGAKVPSVAIKSSDEVLDSVRTSQALQTGSVSNELGNAAEKLAAKKTRAGEAAFKELDAGSDPRVIEAVVKTSELADSPGGVAKAIEQIGKEQAANLPEGTGKKLLDKLCSCGFCPTKNKTSAQLDLFLSRILNQAQAKTAAEAGCAEVALQVQNLLKPVEGLLKDAEKGKTAMYWGRLSNVFEAVDNKTLESVVQKIKAEDIVPVFWAIKSGVVKVNRPTEEFFEHLYHFTDDATRAEIWASKDPVFAIKTKLRERNVLAGFSGDPAAAAQLTDQAIRVTESEIMARAMGETVRGMKYENSKWYDGVANFFSPHYDRLQTIIAANNDLRKSFQIMYKADEPVTDALARYGKEVSEGGLAEIRGLSTDTSSHLAKSRAKVEMIYGKELSMTSPLREKDVKIREIAKRADKFLKAGGNAGENTKLAGGDMDRLGQILDDVWKDKFANDPKWIKEKNLEVHPEYGYYRPAADLHPTDLQIQNPKMRGETTSLRNKYYHISENNTPKRAHYDTQVAWTDTVTYHWTEKAKRPKADKPNEMEEYDAPRSAVASINREKKYVLDASFEEALLGKVTPDLNRADLPAASSFGINKGAFGIPDRATEGMSVSTGKHFASIDDDAIAEILNRAEKARATERPYRETINEVAGRVNGISNSEYQALVAKADESSLKSLRKQFDNDRAKLVSLKGKLDEYVKTEQSSITRQWADDKPEIFKDRNNQMKARIDHMIKRISYFDEQVARKQSSLELELKVADYSKQLEPQKQIRDRNQKIVITGAVVGGTGAAGAAAYAWIPAVKEKVDSVAAEMGIIDKAQKKKADEKKQNWMK